MIAVGDPALITADVSSGAISITLVSGGYKGYQDGLAAGGGMQWRPEFQSIAAGAANLAGTYQSLAMAPSS